MDKKELIKSLIKQANELSVEDQVGLDAFRKRACMILENILEDGGRYAAEILNTELYAEYPLDTYENHTALWEDGRKNIINILKIVLEKIELFGDRGAKKVEQSNRIFIVHGHDREMEAEVVLTVTRLDLDPIILHELPDKGRTVIEKFTDYGDVGYAIVLLSADDYGYSREESLKNAKLRARQNVIFELGFFIGKLGRERVLAIHREEEKFEFPTDISGVIYKPFDKRGAWKLELVKELRACGYKTSADKLK